MRCCLNYKYIRTHGGKSGIIHTYSSHAHHYHQHEKRTSCKEAPNFHGVVERRRPADVQTLVRVLGGLVPAGEEIAVQHVGLGEGGQAGYIAREAVHLSGYGAFTACAVALDRR